MDITNRGFRFLSLILIAILAIGVATPGRAEAIEPLTIVAIAGAAVLVVVLVVYLVVANLHDSQGRKAEAEPRYVACIESDLAPRSCWTIPEPPDTVSTMAAPSAVIASVTQSP